jgi:hypothetical protein
MVPPGVAELTPEKRRSVEHHMRHCAVCKSRAAVLTSPVELLGGIALLPLPVSLAEGWKRNGHPPLQSAQLTAARPDWRAHLRSRAAIIGGLTLLFLGGGAGGVVILHGSQRPATVIAPHHRATAPPATASAVPTTTALPPSPTPSPSAGQWSDAQALVRNASGYHVHNALLGVNPPGGPGSPESFDLTVQPNGNYGGTYTALDTYIGRFDVQRIGGVISVRHLDLFGNFGIAGAPEDALQFFGLTYQQAEALGDSWLPLTAAAQRLAANVISAALAPYVSAQQLADTVLAPPAGTDFMVEPGLDPGSTELVGGGDTLTYRTGAGGYVALLTPTFDLRVDAFGGSSPAPTP